MPIYELNIAFDEAGLNALAASGQKVTIVKQSRGGKLTAWINFSPLLANAISWSEQYSVYSSRTKIQAGARLIISSEAAAIGGSSYTLNSAGSFSDGVSGKVSPTEYQIINADPNMMINSVPMVTAGLVQAAIVNGMDVSSPTCAVEILYNQAADFIPVETVMVYTSSYSDNGIVISSVAGNALTVTYTTSNTASIRYDDQTNQFIMT